MTNAIGNDLIDLDDDDSRAACRHPRWDQRVFTPGERDEIAAAADADRLRCLLWSAKEAAFKLLRRTMPDLGFSPSRFGVELVSMQSARVRHAGRSVAVAFEQGRGFLHAIASEPLFPRPPLCAAVMRLRDGESGSEALRGFAIGLLASRWERDPRSLSIARDDGMPWLIVDGSRHGTLSLSHHGRFAAFAWSGDAALPKRRFVGPPRAASARGSSSSR